MLVHQLKAASLEYIILYNPSTGEAPIYDVMVDDSEIHVIEEAVQEGALAAMADGYAKASGKTPFVMMARPRLAVMRPPGSLGWSKPFPTMHPLFFG